MEFFLIYIYHLIFVYGVCCLDGKAFFIWPYTFYILVYVAVFWVYLCFGRYLVKVIKTTFGKMKSSIICFIRFVVSVIKKSEIKGEAGKEEKSEDGEEKNV